MNTFNQDVNKHQIKWRKNAKLSSNAKGWQGRYAREWILPKSIWEEGLWPGIRKSLPDYLRGSRVQKHLDVHNLKSSWILCANLYFPFRDSADDRALLASFLHERIHNDILSVDAVELEYAEEGDLSPSALLGEVGGKRGSGQTSPDVAFLVNGRRGLVLTESKYTEHSFYPCSARSGSGGSGRPPNPDSARCNDLRTVLENPDGMCHQAAWGRRYWKHLMPAFRRETLPSLRRCPAATAGYQLLRQQALAEGIATSGKYEFVATCLAVDERNADLAACLKTTGIADIHSWGGLFAGKAYFAVFHHQDWVAWVRAYDEGNKWSNWLAYVEARYGFAQ